MRRFFFGVLVIVLLATVGLVALHTYYYFTPVELSAEAQSLDQRAATLPRDTDNGLRLLGLLAPRGLDPVVFGTCLLDEERRYWASVEMLGASASNDELESFSKRLDDARRSWTNRCTEGRPQLTHPKVAQLPSLKLDSADGDWTQWAQVTVDPLLWSRYEQVMGAEPRYLAPSRYSSGMENFGTLSALHRIRAAQAVTLWKAGKQDAALDIWEASMRQWAGIARESLISNMLAVAAMGQSLASMQTAWRQAPGHLNQRTLNRITEVTHLADSLPESLAGIVVTEWAITRMGMNGITDSKGETWDLRNWWTGLTYQANHTLNLLAAQTLSREAFWRESAKGASVSSPAAHGACLTSDRGSLGLFKCLVFERNPMGRVLADISNNGYQHYGSRVADLLNFAAATRWLAHAKAQQFNGDSLDEWLKNPPPDQRDLFSGLPFSLDTKHPQALLFKVRVRVQVLGEAGEYRLPL